ncbi:hypothetical protein ALC56_08948 [Trachymyrmex septentrionalis]|uniref:Uncharacterized protein n=1 Tax=Trachymyrmex septentrionalis TaxID=34720 RepID=A0A195FAC0_9HYME|nr:hypothetical protein ALC56_08948 [Trachymyrmex septentrionalis]
MQVAPSGTACKRILRKYVCSTGREEASLCSECYETLDVGWMRLGIECVTPALLEHRWRRGGNSFGAGVFHAECKISLPFPGMLVVQSSADTLRDSIKNSLSKVRRGLARARIPPGTQPQIPFYGPYKPQGWIRPLKLQNLPVPGQCDLVDPSIKLDFSADFY